MSEIMGPHITDSITNFGVQNQVVRNVRIRSLHVLPLEVQVVYGSSRFWRPTILMIVHNAAGL